MFEWLFNNNCDCADRVITYLEAEKYELKPRVFTPEQRKEIQKQYKEGAKALKDNPFYSKLTRLRIQQNLYKKLFFEKVEKKK